MNKSVMYQGMDAYMVLEAEEGEEYEYRMLFSNEIPCLLPVRLDAVNQKGNLIYPITGYRPLQDIYEKQWINYEEIQMLVGEILQALESVKRYLLLPESLLLVPDAIFCKTEEREVKFLYAPGYHENAEKQLNSLMEYLMGRVRPEDVDGILLIWKIYTMTKENRGNTNEIRQWLIKGKEQTRAAGAVFPTAKEKKLLLPKLVGRKKERKAVDLLKLGKLLCVILFVLFILSGGLVLYHIYYYGILVWKRNLLVVILLLLISDGILLWKLCERDKKENQIRSLFPLK